MTRSQKAIGDRPVVIKPNNVAIDNRLPPPTPTHRGNPGVPQVDRQIGNAVIAESAADGPALEGFANYGYTR